MTERGGSTTDEGDLDPVSYWGAGSLFLVLGSAAWLVVLVFRGFFWFGGGAALGPLSLAILAVSFAAKARAEARRREGRSLAWPVSLVWAAVVLAAALRPTGHYPFG